MSQPILYCPRCAEAMGRVHGELTCEKGRMPLSKSLEQVMLERFGDSVRADVPAPPAGASFYCPACRVAMNADMRCPDCQKTLFDVRFAIVDLHPHFPFDAA